MADLRVRVHKAQSILPDDDIPDLTLFVNKEIPEREADKPSSYIAEVDAEKIVAALFRCLPGGTIDHMLTEMMRRRASQLHVSLAARRAASREK